MSTPSIIGSRPKKKPAVTVREVSLDDIYIDPEYQRPGNKKKIDTIAKEWRDSRARIPMLSARKTNGKSYTAYDGQHTVEAAKKKGFTHMDCAIYDLTQEEEAEDFVGINNAQTKPNTRDRFKARVASNDASAVAIEGILNQHKLSGIPNTGMTNLKAIGAVEEIKDRFGESVLNDTLDLAIATWGTSPKYLRRYTLIAIASLLAVYGQDLDTKRFVSKFSPEDPAALEMTAKGQNRQRHYLTIPAALAEHMVSLYNHRIAAPKQLDHTKLASVATP